MHRLLTGPWKPDDNSVHCLCSLMNSYRKEAEQHGAKLVLNSEVIGGQMSGECLSPTPFAARVIGADARNCCMWFACRHHHLAVQTASWPVLAVCICHAHGCNLYAKGMAYQVCHTAHSPNGRPASVAQGLCNHPSMRCACRSSQVPTNQGQGHPAGVNRENKDGRQRCWPIRTICSTQAARPARRHHSRAAPCQGPLLHNGRSAIPGKVPCKQ